MTLLAIVGWSRHLANCLKAPHPFADLVPTGENAAHHQSPSGSQRLAAGANDLTKALVYDTVIHMEEVLTIRLPKGTRRRLERRAKTQKLSVSQLVRRALEQDELLTSLASARTELLPQARAQGIYTDEDVFAIVS